MGYRQIIFRDSNDRWGNLVVVRCPNSVSNNDLLDWYCKEYLIERSRVVVSGSDPDIIECPLESKS